MIALHMLLTALGKHVVRCYNDEQKIIKASGVLLLSPEETPSNDFVYVAQPHEAVSVLQKLTACENLVIFTVGDSPEFSELTAKSLAAVCVTDLNYVSLHNELFRRLEIYEGWKEMLDLNSSNGISGLLQNGGKLADASVYLLNPQYEIVTGSTKPEFNESLRSVIDYNQTIISSAVTHLFADLDQGKPFACTEGEDGLYICTLPIKNGSCLLGYLLAASKYDLALLKQILFLLSIHTFMLLSKSDAWYHGRISFQALAQDLLSENMRNPEELQMRLQRLPHAPKKFMRCILVRPHNSFVYNMSKLAADAEHIFPADNIAVIGNELFILVSSDYSTCPLACNLEEFDNYLERYDAHAMISNPSKTARGLRIVYLQCKGIFDVALKVRYQMTKRYFYFERFSPYYIIHLCAQQAKNAFGTDDIVFLCHPGVLALTRYDRTNNGDLRDVMFTYLLNRCSISRTAQALYMHRNTIIYKINKIEEILGEPMDDPYLRHSLMFSCMLIRYREIYQNEHVQLSVFERTTP